MRTVVWVPYRATHERALIFKRVLPQIKSLGLDVIIRDSGHDPFSVANSWNLCAADSGDWDVAVRWGADFLMESTDSVWEAIEATQDHPYVHAFDKVTKLTIKETERVLKGHKIPKRDDPLPFGGVSAITREAFEAAGGYDPAFLGWGHEDRAFRHCLRTLAGKEARVPGRMIMLRHPGRAHIPEDAFYANEQKNLALANQYMSITDPVELRTFINSR